MVNIEVNFVHFFDVKSPNGPNHDFIRSDRCPRRQRRLHGPDPRKLSMVRRQLIFD